MVVTNLEYLEQYCTLHPRFETAFRALRQLAEEPFHPGRFEIDGSAIYVNAFSYDTHPREGSKFEAHREYADVMYIRSGCEEIDCCLLSRLQRIVEPYNREDDALLAAMQAERSTIIVKAGDVVIFFPEDGHSPGIQHEHTCKVEKMVVKVRL